MHLDLPRPAAAPVASRHRGSALWLSLLKGAVTGFLLVAAIQVGHITLRGNFHPVIPEKVFRCAQLSSRELERRIRGHGIRTLVNLRGSCPDQSWYVAEVQAAERLGVHMIDLSFYSWRPPPVEKMRALVEVLWKAPGPVLVHCQSGADRTGLASAMVLLLRTRTSLPEARRQLALRFGHWGVGRTGWMHRFFDCYECWLESQMKNHHPFLFRRWVLNFYRPLDCVPPGFYPPPRSI
jgi:protein tyrosine phosphatase (PTP) superfamily phosphohydrolase (DUF442 family)